MAVDSELDRDIVEWEIAACRAMVAVIGMVILMLLALSPAIGGSLALTGILLATIAIVHVLLQKTTLERLASQPGKHAWIERLRWAAATIEVTFGTCATLLALRAQGPVWAATSPVTMIYVYGIVASSFRLRLAMSVYASVLATAQWLAVYYLAILPRLDAATLAEVRTAQPWAAWERAAFLLFAGGLLALAAHRLRDLALANRRLSRARRAQQHGLERRWVTVLFCDLRNFTAMCEHRRAEDVMAILNTFYERATEIIARHGGHVNKFLGDGVLALFGAPDKQPGHAVAAVKCARALVRAADELRARGGVWEDLQVGIGLDTGDVVLGALGAADALEYTAVGATVNRAARLQAYSASSGRRVVLSARTATELGRTDALLPLGEAHIKGVDQPVRIYTPR